jgi:hypothetical protein
MVTEAGRAGRLAGIRQRCQSMPGIGQYSEVCIRRTPATDGRLVFPPRRLGISRMLRLSGERIVCARIAGCKLPHLSGDIDGEGLIVQIAGKRLHCFDPQKGLRPSVRGGIRPEFGYAVARQRASFF